MKTEDISHLRWMHDRFIYVYGENQDVDYLIKLRSIISELEALQQPKRCDGCGYGKTTINSVICGKNGTYKEADDYCKYYNPKEQ